MQRNCPSTGTHREAHDLHLAFPRWNPDLKYWRGRLRWGVAWPTVRVWVIAGDGRGGGFVLSPKVPGDPGLWQLSLLPRLS